MRDNKRGIWVGGLAIVLALTSVLVAPTSVQKASAYSGSDFTPGLIITDSKFYDPNAMSQSDIQSFLDSHIGSCSNGQCLNVLTSDTTSRAADRTVCGAYAGAAGELASAIIFKVQQACGISAKVILVTLQKEQGLVTSKAPSTATLARAMGYACPDSTGGSCDSTYYGFYNQIYWAAWQLKRYSTPTAFGSYQPGVRAIQYSPNASCGSLAVNIQNNATAALYNYTPYTPNAAALANLNGVGDGCSSYGNRNFWVYYNNWFGSPTGRINPIGSLDAVTALPTAVEASGWTFDPDTNDPISISVTVNGGTAVTSVANLSRPDVNAAYGGVGDLHGFDVTIPVTSAGTQNVCVTGLNVSEGVDTLLGCSTVTVAGASPRGVIDSVQAVTGGTSVSGWAFDADTTDPISVQVSVNGGTPATVTAGQSRPDVGAAFGDGPLHGYSMVVPLSGTGAQSICVTALNVGFGSNTALGCASTSAPATGRGANPVGAVDTLLGAGRVITVGGWALDADTTSPISVRVTVDGTATVAVANTSRPDVASAYPGFGDQHGFTITVPTSAGNHSVCAVALNSGGGTDSPMGCWTVNSKSGSPTGALDSVSATPGTFTASGWAFDPDTVSSISIDIEMDGTAVGTYTASASRSDIAAIFPGYGDQHGFSQSFTAAPGKHSVCVYADDAVAPGSRISLGCKSVTGPSGSPVGAADSFSRVPGGIAISGWAIDPDTVSPVTIRVQIDGAAQPTFVANQARPDVGAVYPMYGPNHGFSQTVSVSGGTHTVCAYAVNTGAGSDSLLGCTSQNFPSV